MSELDQFKHSGYSSVWLYDKNSNATTVSNTFSTEITTPQSDTLQNKSKISDKSFFIIEGTYITEQLAKSAVEKLKTNGYSNAELVGKTDNDLWRIAYDGYTTKEEALPELDKIKQSVNASAWLFDKNAITTPVSNTVSNQITTSQADTIQGNSNIFEKKFFIIAQSYNTEQLARDGVNELKAKGFADAVLVGKSESGNWRIAYKGFATREEALSEIEEFRQLSQNTSLWIFEKK